MGDHTRKPSYQPPFEGNPACAFHDPTDSDAPPLCWASGAPSDPADGSTVDEADVAALMAARADPGTAPYQPPPQVPDGDGVAEEARTGGEGFAIAMMILGCLAAWGLVGLAVAWAMGGGR